MPIYESEEYPREKLEEIRKTNVCKECGGELALFRVSIKDPTAFVACKDYPQNHHEGIEKPASRWKKEGLASLNIEKRRELMEEEMGTEITKKLIKYEGVTSLTKNDAKTILNAVYPLAPEDEIMRAMLLCVSYGLNPLMKHVFLIPFKNSKTGKTDWVTVLGIKAKRLLASRRGNYSYVDDTPRVMTKDEQIKRFGEVDNSKLWVITKVKDPATGAEAVGFGFWPKSSQPYGTDKGNTAFNMATIRSESQALDRLRPGEMPVNFEVMPEEVAGNITVTEDVVEGEAKEIAEPDTSLGICPIHNIPLRPGKGNFPPYCPTKIDGAGRSKGKKVWCKGKPVKEEKKPEDEANLSGFIDMDWLTEALAKIQSKNLPDWKNSQVAARIDALTGKSSQTVTKAVGYLNKEQAAKFVQEVEDILAIL